eukprot:gene5796-biopygen10296
MTTSAVNTLSLRLARGRPANNRSDDGCNHASCPRTLGRALMIASWSGREGESGIPSAFAAQRRPESSPPTVLRARPAAATSTSSRATESSSGASGGAAAERRKACRVASACA